MFENKTVGMQRSERDGLNELTKQTLQFETFDQGVKIIYNKQMEVSRNRHWWDGLESAWINIRPRRKQTES